MKSLFGWLSDPYIDVMLIAAAMVWLSTLPQPKATVSQELYRCASCLEVHDGSEARCAISQALASLVGTARQGLER